MAPGRVIGWSPPQEFVSADQQAWNVTLQSPTEVAHLADMNGDGRADLVYKSAIGDVFFFANRGVAGWGPRQFMSVQDNSPPAPFANASVRAAESRFRQARGHHSEHFLGRRSGLPHLVQPRPAALQPQCDRAAGFGLSLPRCRASSSSTSMAIASPTLSGSSPTG